MEEYEEKWRKSISATTLDFQLDEETGRTKVRDGSKGDHRWYDHIEDDQIYKEESNDGIYYRRGSSWNGRGCHFSRRAMRKASSICRRTAKVFVRGRVSEEDDNASKLICEEK